MIEPQKHPWIENAILIYGPRKGGTTLFQNLLDGGGELFVYPAELKLKFLARTPRLTPSEYFSRSKLPANDPAGTPGTGQQGNWEPEAYFRHTREYNVSPESFDRAGYETAWRSSPNAQCSVGELIRNDVVRVFDNCRFRSVPPRMWCAKEVGGHTGKVLQLWRGIFPGGRLLLLVRDPLMVVRSVLHDRRMVSERPSLWNIIKQTYDAIAVVAGIAGLRGQKHVLVLCYEDLVADTEGSMRRVAEFLGVEFTSVLTMPTLLGEKVVVRTSSRVDTKVFVSDAKWTDGLTLRERTIIAATRIILRLWPQLRFDYHAMRKELAAKPSPQ